MQEFIIERYVRTDRNGYQFLIQLYNNILSQANKEVMIDFSICQRFDANLASVLGALLDLLKEKGIKVWISKPTYVGVRRILARNLFLKAFLIDTENEDKETFIQYKKFSINDSQKFKEYIEDELISKQKFPRHTDLVGKKISESIYEIYANAISHGGCTHVHCCGEYNPEGAIPTLDMTIVDCGQTIPKNVNKYLAKRDESTLGSCQCIQWAMKEGNTTKNVPGGLGLSLLRNFIELNKGALQVVSSRGMLDYREGKLSLIELSSPFPGTIVNMEFNFNDNKIYYMSKEEQQIDLNDLL